MRILYLEDNPNDAELTLRAFKFHNPKLEFIVAGDVHSALGIIQNHPPEYFDIFLSDFELPDGNAIQFLETIHRRGLLQPVVVVTGNDDPQVRSRTLQQGIAGFFNKEGKYLDSLPEKIEKIHKSYRENRKRQSVIRVLYAEHNPVDAELTQLHFASHAAHIVLQVISSASEVEEHSQPGGKNPEYDVILLDTDIQKEGDLSLLKKLKSDWKIEQPVILLTAPGEDQITVQALQLGAENCVIKNIGYFQLLPAIIEVAFTKSQLVKEQKASLERERLFRLMTENARDIVFRLRFSPDFGFDYISTAVKRLTGYNPEEFYKNPALLMEIVDPEDFRRLQEMLEKPTRFIKPILLRWHARDGHLLWVEAKGSFIHDSEGKFVALEGIARDISERIRFESALQAENERRQELETIINKSPVIVIRWKPKLGQPLDYISENISSLGYKAKDFLDGKILFEDIVHPEDAELMSTEVTRHAQAKDVQYRMRYRLVTKKGETRWVDDLTWVVKDEQGNPLYHQGIVTDITEQLRSEQKRKESEQLYSSVVKASPDLVTIVDLQAKIVYLSPKARELFRLDSEDEWVGHIIYQILAPGSRDHARKNVQAFLNGKASANDSYEAIRKDGTSVWIEIRSSLLKNTDNTPTGIISIITDVTQRRETQQALQNSEEKYRRIVDTSNEGIWVTDENFIITFSNKQIAEMLGFTIEEMFGKRSDFCSFPEDKKDIQRKMDERRAGKSHQYERRYLRKDGSTLWVIVTANAMMDESGRFLGSFAMLTDITARKEIEQALEQTESQYHQLVEQIPAVTYVDLNDELATNLYTSPQIETVVGYTAQEWKEEPGLWLRIIHPEDIDRVKAEHERTNLTGEPFHIEYRLIHKDGHIVWVDDRSALLRGPTGEADRWQGVLVDITERKAREEDARKSLELFDLALKGADLGFWDWNIPAGKFSLSPRCAEMLGYQPQEIEPTVKNWDSLTHPGDLPQVYKTIDEHFQGITPSFEIDLRVWTKSGEYKWVQIRGKVIEREKDGTPLRAAGTLRDIAFRKNNEEEEHQRIQRNQDERQSIIQMALDPAVSSGNFEIAIRHITENVANVLEVERASIWMYTEGEDGILCADLFERSKNRHSKGLTLQARDYPTYFESLRAGRAIAAQDARSDPRTFEFAEGYLQPLGIASLLDSAIRVRSKMVGVVCFEQVGEPRHWHQDEITYGGEIADQVAQVILNLERHTAQEATRSNETKFRTILEQSAEGFVLLDEDGFVIDWNRTTERLFEIARDDAIGHYFWDLLFRVLLPERQTEERYNRLKKSIEAALKKDHSPLFEKPMEAEIVNLKGEHIFIQQTIFPLFISGQRFLGSFTQDITDRKNAEQGIRESEARFKALFEQANDAIFLMEGDRFIDCNKRTEIIFGVNREEIIGKNPFDFSPAVQANGKKSIIAGAKYLKAALSGTPQVFEWIHLHKDGTPFDADISLNRMEINGKPYIQALVRDISDRKQAEKAIRESENRFRSIFEQANDAIFILDENIMVDCNHQTELLFGWNRNEFLGKTPPELSPETQPDGHNSVSQGMETYKLALKGEPQRFEWVHLKKDGTQFDVEVSLNRIEIGGKAMVQAIIRDITERKIADRSLETAEKRYRGLFEDSPVAILVEDFSYVKNRLDLLKKKGVKDFPRYFNNHPEVVADCLHHVLILDVNRSALKVFQVTNKSDILNNLSILFPDGNHKSFIDELVNIAQGIINFHWETVNQTLTRERIDVDMHWSVAPGYEKSLARVIISSENITERRKAEDALQESETRYRGLFEDSPISLWEEDFSGVKQVFDSLKKKGVKDFHRYIQNHSEVVKECLDKVRIVDINKATLRLYGAAAKEDLLKNLNQVLTDDSLSWFVREIEEIASGKTEFHWEGVNQTLSGGKIFIDMHWSAAPGFEDTLTKVIVSVEDITARKQAENALGESEASYRTLAENLPGIVYRYHFNREFGMQWFNNMILPLTGFTDEEVSEFNSWGKKLVFPEDDKQFHILVREAIAKKQTYSGEYRIRKKNGEIRNFFERGQPVYDEQGKPIYVDGIILDVTERHQIESALHESEKRYRGLFEDSPVSLWEEDFSEVKKYIDTLKDQGVKNFKKYVSEHPDVIFDCAKKVKVLVVIRATVGLYKAKNKEELLTNLGSIFSGESILGVVDEIRNIAEGNYDFEGESVNQTLDGQKIDVYLHWAVAPGYEDTLSRVIISITDITEKKKAEQELRQSEEKYRELMERMRSAVAVYQAVDDGKDFEFVDFNLRAEEIEGAKRIEVLGKRVTKVFPGAERFGILKIFRRVWQTGKAEFFPAAVYKDEKGNESWRENWVYRLPDGKVVAIYSDVTQRIHSEEAIRISEARYRSLVENQTAIISRTDLDGNLTFVNDEFCKVFGRKKETLLGSRIKSTVLPEDQHLVGRAIKEAMKPPFHSRLENRNVTAQGIRWFRWENSAILDSNGKIIEMQYVGWDITEQKITQLALQRRDEILEAVSFTATRLLEAADWKRQAPIILEKLGTSAEVDRVYLLQYPDSHGHLDIARIPENLIEWAAPGIKHRLQDSQLPNLVEFSEAMVRWKTTLTKGEIVMGVPDRLPKKEQAFLQVLGIKEIILVPIRLEGRLWGLLGFDQVNTLRTWDNTELEALKTFADTFASAIQRNKAYSDLLDRETRLHAILEASKDAIVVALKEMTVYANTSFRKLFGLSPQDDLEDISIDSLIAPVDRERYREISQHREQGKSTPTHYELKALKKNGTEFDLEVHVSSYELMDETYTLALLRDITEKKQHDREIEVVAQVSTALRKAKTRQEMVPIIVNQLVEVMHGEGGVLTLEDPMTHEMVIQFASGEFADQVGRHIAPGKSVSGLVKRTKKPHFSHDLANDLFFEDHHLVKNIKESVVYPLIIQNSVIGTLSVGRQSPFEKTELRVIASIAEMAVSAIQRSTLHEQTQSRLEKLIALREIDNAISSTLDLHQIINIILTSSQKFLNVDAADILLYEEKTKQLKYAYGIGFRTNLMEGFSVNIGKGWAGTAARSRKPMFIPDINQASSQAVHPAPSAEELVSCYTVPLITNNQIKGVMECFTRSPLNLNQDWIEFINLLAGQAAIAINSAQLFEEIKVSNIQLVHAYDDTIEGWSRAMDIRDKETEGHTQRVVELTLRLARVMGVPEDQLTHIKRGTLLHDIGKLVVPDSILFKPSSLTDLEWKIMKKHPLNAYNMLASVDYLKPALDIPYCHHEHWDGSGYPRGLKGEEIPLAARIFSVVDIWDALLSNRPYRPAWTRVKTLAYIKGRAGEDLDPKVVDEFLKIISEPK
jgi:PAS domain S-box-containing protein